MGLCKRLVSLVVLVSLVAAGCGGQQGGQEGAGQDFTVARTGDVDTLDPHTATAFQTFQALGLVYDSLLELDEDYQVVPGIAEEYAFDDDGTTLTLNLREGLTFHDGSDLTSEDVGASIERILDEETGAAARSNFLAIEEVRTPDDLTVELALSRPDSSLPVALTSLNAAIAPSEAIDSGEIRDTPVGSGAFVFEDWTQGQSFSVSAFEDHWAGRPDLDTVQIRVIPDESSVLAGLQSQNFQMGVLTDPSVALQVEDSGLTLDRTPALSYHTLMLNGAVGPLRETEVRQAISCAVDRQEVVDSAAFGEGEVAGPLTMLPEYEDLDPTAGLPCDPPDPEAARGLLEEAGYGDGFELDTIVMTGGYATAVDQAQSLAAQLEDIGVTLNVESLETNVYVDRWLAADFDAAVALNGGSPDPYLMYGRYFAEDANFAEVAGYTSEEIDGLLAEGLSQTDDEARRETYDRLNERLVEEAPWVWTFNSFDYNALQPTVEGFQPERGFKSLREVSVG